MNYYYATIDENDIVTGVYSLPLPVTSDGYIEITEQQYNDSVAENENSIIGKRYDAETNTFVTPVYYYALLDSQDICTEILEYNSPLDLTDVTDIIAIDSNDTTIIGLWYNRTTGEFVTPPFHITATCSTDEINVEETDECLSDRLDTINTNLSGKAPLDSAHSHTNKTVLDGITAENVASWNSDTSGADGEDGATFTPSVSADGVISWTNDKGLTNPTSVNIKGPAGADGADGADGTNGVSPTVSVSKSGTVTTITITDANGTHTATINDGVNGEDGADGADGTEITAAQVLAKLLTVDGSGSGLDADTLDGHDTDYFAPATHSHDGTVETLEVPTSGWSLNSNVYSITISNVSWANSTITPIVDIVVPTTLASARETLNDWSKVLNIAIGDGTVTITSSRTFTAARTLRFKLV